MSTVFPTGGAAGAATGTAATPAKAEKSVKQQALEEALAVVKQVALGNAGAGVLREVREQRAAAAQERLGRAQERYQLLRKTMIKVLGAGDARSAARIAKEAASLARDVAGASKDVAQAAKGAAPADAETWRGALDGFLRQARQLVLGVRNIVDAARIANGGSEPGRLQAQRSKDINRARRDTDDAFVAILREIGTVRFAATRATRGFAIDA